MIRIAGISGARFVVMSAMTAGCGSRTNPEQMTFFVTSVRTGTGGNLGGLARADAHCQELAEAVGSRNRQWRAYLSATQTTESAAVNARDRIGSGPWFNAKGVQIAASIDDLHGPAKELTARTALDEHGNIVLGGIPDILTGSNPDGTAASGATCNNWASTDGRAMVGHHNRAGSCSGDRASSWNSAHESKGCTLPALQSMGSDVRLYCFAVD